MHRPFPLQMLLSGLPFPESVVLVPSCGCFVYFQRLKVGGSNTPKVPLNNSPPLPTPVHAMFLQPPSKSQTVFHYLEGMNGFLHPGERLQRATVLTLKFRLPSSALTLSGHSPTITLPKHQDEEGLCSWWRNRMWKIRLSQHMQRETSLNR